MDAWDGLERRHSRKPEDLGWIKKALIGAIITLMAHFAGGIWWAATQTAKMDFLQSSLIELSQDLKDASADRYRGADAKRDFLVIQDRMERNEDRILNLENKITYNKYKGEI